jgi:hypothetical protein
MVVLKDLVQAVANKVEEANKVLDSLRSKEVAKDWDTRYVNDLPNAAFAVVEKGYKEGMNKGSKHLPHHNKSVKSATENSSVDLPHY